MLKKNIIKEDLHTETLKNTLFRMSSEVLVCLFLTVVTLAVYWHVTNQEFVGYDDDAYVTENSYIKKGLTLENIAWSFSFDEKEGTYWNPLTWLSHILVFHLHGLDPGMHHLANLILHILNIILLFLIFRWMTGSLWKSAFVAAIFALHPLNVDSVAWVSERKNVLSTLFWMLTILAYIYYSRQGGLHRYLLVLLAFALGLLAKPVLITLPFVLLLLDYWPLGRLRFSAISSILHLIIEKIPLFILSGVSLYITILSQIGAGEPMFFKEVPMDLRIANALVTCVSYIGKMIWPHSLAVHYPYPDAISIWNTVLAGLFLICVSFFVVLKLNQKPYLSVGWLWFLGTLVPVSGLVQNGIWPAMADRFAYIPLIGLFVIIAWGVPDLIGKWRHKKICLAVSSAVVISFITAMTLQQLQYWNNTITLFQHALDETEDNCVAHYNIGMAFAKQKQMDKAVKHFSEVLRIHPDHADSHYSLGVAMAHKGNIPKAIAHFREAIRIKPEFIEARMNLQAILKLLRQKTKNFEK